MAQKEQTSNQGESDDARIHSPSVSRNRDVILEVLRELLPSGASGTQVLEVGSGSGEHAVHVANALTEITWIPTDPDATARASITAWREFTGLANQHDGR